MRETSYFCRQAARLAGVVTLGCALGWPPAGAQAGGAGPASTSAQSPAETLQNLMRAQHQAVATGDSTAIVPASEQLAAYALRLEAAFYSGEQKLGEAEGALGEAYALEPTVELGLEWMAVQLADGHREAAARTSAGLVALTDQSPSIYLVLGNVYQQGGDVGDAIAMVSRGVAAAEDSAVAHLALGSLYWTLNEQQYNPDTLREFERAYELAPQNMLAMLNLGRILSEYHRFAEADGYLKLAAQADGFVVDARLQLGLNEYAQHHLTSARAVLEEVAGGPRMREEHPVGLSRALFVLSRIAIEEQRPEDAARLSAQVGALHGQIARESAGAVLSESVGLDSAVAERHQGPAVPAQKAGVVPAELALRLKTITAESLNDAGTSLARRQQYAAALPFFEKAAAAEPMLIPVMRNLGLAAFHAAHWAEAVKALGAALQQNSEDEVVRRDLPIAEQNLLEADGKNPK